eukprot:8477191-Alexandrium_andersonii.AAC.1
MRVSRAELGQAVGPSGDEGEGQAVRVGRTAPGPSTDKTLGVRLRVRTDAADPLGAGAVRRPELRLL